MVVGNALVMPRLWCGNIDYNASQQDVEELFAKFGNITLVNCRDGFAFVDYATDEEAARAREELDGTEFRGRKIRVEPARGDGLRPLNQPRTGGGDPNDPEGASRHLYVARIPDAATEKDIADFFGSYGEGTHARTGGTWDTLLAWEWCTRMVGARSRGVVLAGC